MDFTESNPTDAGRKDFSSEVWHSQVVNAKVILKKLSCVVEYIF